MVTLEPDDSVVLVMGVSGQGKSTFIDLLAPGTVKIGKTQHAGKYQFNFETSTSMADRIPKFWQQKPRTAKS